MKITEDITYVGVYDKNLRLFESQYSVPEGITYNSCVISDETTAVIDTVDERAVDEWLGNVREALGTRKPDYLVVSHMEPDHSAGITALKEAYPEVKIVGNAKTFTFLEQLFDCAPAEDERVVVSDNSELSLGKHTLKFVMAPMVHWPEVMVSVDLCDKILFSADAFGRFGDNDESADWDGEAAAYYLNIVGKYGVQVKNLLKKLAGVELEKICPTHGPVLTKNLAHYIERYEKWSDYEADSEGVLIVCASIHHNTLAAARVFKERLDAQNIENELVDITCEDKHRAFAKAVKYRNLVLAASSYDGGVFAPMEDFLALLRRKNFRGRKVGIIENGTWAPSAARAIRAYLDEMKDITVVEPTVTIKSSLKGESETALESLAHSFVKD